MSANSAAINYNVKDYGAAGDGSNIDSYAIDKAISDASKDRDGVVLIPKGIYLCYSIHLKSNITIRFEDGAVIKAALPTDSTGYDIAEPFEGKTYQDFGHSHWQNSLIWGVGIRNVRIEGKGLVDGRDVLSRGQSKNKRLANKALAMKDCKNVSIKDLTMLSCGHFAMLMTGVDSLLIEDVMIDSNRDGIDIDCCENVLIRNCDVNTLNDDAIVLKCSYAMGYMKPTANVIIEDCNVSGYDVGTLYDGTRKMEKKLAPDQDGPTGRIKLGTESNSAFRNIVIRNCSLTHSRGLALETVDGAVLEDVVISDITMHDICNSPIYMVIGKRMRAPEGTPQPIFRNVTLKNIKATDCDSRYGILLSGQQGNPLDNITLSNVYVEYNNGLKIEDYKLQKGRNRFFEKHDPHYPEPSAHGIQPAWGMNISHVGKITLENVKLVMKANDERPKIFTEDVKISKKEIRRL